MPASARRMGRTRGRGPIVRSLQGPRAAPLPRQPQPGPRSRASVSSLRRSRRRRSARRCYPSHRHHRCFGGCRCWLAEPASVQTSEQPGAGRRAQPDAPTRRCRALWVGLRSGCRPQTPRTRRRRTRQALPVDITGLVVPDEEVQRVPVVGHLPRPVRPRNRAEQSGARAAGDHRLAAGAQRWPRDRARARARAADARVGLEQVQRAAGGVDQNPPQSAIRNPDGRSLDGRGRGLRRRRLWRRGGGSATAAPAATVRPTSGITAALARKVMGLLRVMLAPSGWGVSTVAATGGDRITRRVVRKRKPRSHRPERLARGDLQPRLARGDVG